MISVIVCSIDRPRHDRVRAMYARSLAGVPHEVIGVLGAQSMCAGYNNGMRHAKGDVLVFSHDDIEILSDDFAGRLRRQLAEFDVVGVAGTDRMVHPMWSFAGPPHLYGQVANPFPDGTYGVEIFSVPARSIGGMRAMDGLFLAARREVAVAVGWDEVTFAGWHGYDADFTFRAHLAGYRLGVAGDLALVHHSRGSLDDNWQRSALAFAAKFAGRLPACERREFASCEVRVPDLRGVLEVMAPSRWD